MKDLKNRILEAEQVRRFADELRRLKPGLALQLTEAAGSLLPALLPAITDSAPRVLLVARDDDHAEMLRDDAAFVLGESAVKLFAARPTHDAVALDLHGTIAQVETLQSLRASASAVIVASPAAAIQKFPAPASFDATRIELRTGADQPFQDLIRRLEASGFQRKEFVESYGDFAVRGGILDVMPYNGDHPLRLEFWGDSLESIREFDILSQRSIRTLGSAVILPSFADADDRAAAASALTHSLFEYLPPDTLVLLAQPSAIEQEIEEQHKEGIEGIFSAEEFFASVRRFPLVAQTLKGEQAPPGTVVAATCSLASVSQPSINGSVVRLLDTLADLTRRGFAIWLTSDTEKESARLQELIEETLTDPSQLPHGSVSRDHDEVLSLLTEHKPIFVPETFHEGFVWQEEKVAVLTEHEIFGRARRRGTEKRRRFKGFSQKELQQLRPGDFVVHVDHGIGVYDGLTKLRIGAAEQEAMKLLFLEDDVLYVNLNFINRVQKYSSQEGHAPVLSRLGGAEWEKAKARAKRKLKDIARDIIALYARRKREPGFAFAPDTHWQRELEASFMYEDTPDQASATEAVKVDMEQATPMDRLICGDVGFGKTEVAVRAAFKAVSDGKQVAVLVPTTILALQHFETFRDRLSRYTVRVEQLTRFRSAREQKEIVGRLAEGAIDIVIGTHRILSKDILFKDLGLLIIDEEHRFGVSAKEKLRQKRASVDTLSLTATPIPRTLHFSLIGARDLSLINTPPRNRMPVVTEIVPADSKGRQIHWKVIREAMLHELHRHGQVYFVHDRVDNIESVAGQIRTQVPEATVRVIHGQMHAHETEKALLDFLEQRSNVLVATKIIESGLDIPNVNTMIINRADRFGLAELYQLRGRVGRSNVQAYAYLLVPPLSALPKQTMRRLQAIEEFTELGSGFNLAMRDLEIRGAGNLLGAEQSGFIMEMGFEMYERILREAVEELKAEEFADVLPAAGSGKPVERPDVVVETDCEALLPDVYVESATERLDLYRRLYRVETADELSEMRKELVDRFGEYPEEVEHLFAVLALRLAASRAGFRKLSLHAGSFAITLPEETDQQFYGVAGESDSPFQRLLALIGSEERSAMRFRQEGKNLLITAPVGGKNCGERLSGALAIVERCLAATTPSD